jgi:hypothetical protein
MITYKVTSRGHIEPPEMQVVGSWLLKRVNTKDGPKYEDTSVRVFNLAQINQIRSAMEPFLDEGESWYVDVVGAGHEITLVPVG